MVNEELIESYKKVESKLDNIFEDVKSGKDLELDEISSEMEEFAMEVSKETNILAQMRLLSRKDDYTFDHSLDVSILSMSLGKWIDMSDHAIYELAMVGLFHDIGKLRIPDEILKKPGRLTETEFEEIKNHPSYGYEILKKTGKFSENVLRGVLEHHEKINGTGYPYGLKGDEISDYGKIVAICDIYHALASKRYYKEKESPLIVADYIRAEAFTSLDPEFAHIFLNNISKFYVGNKVLLSNGEIGEIIYIHPQDKTKPIVKVGDDFINFLTDNELKILEIIS